MACKESSRHQGFSLCYTKVFFYSVTCYTKVFPLSNQVFPLCYTNLFLSVTARSSHLLQQGFPLCHTKVFPSVIPRFPLCHTKVFLSVIPRFSHLLYQGLPLCHTKVFPSVTPRFFPFVTPRFPPFVTGQRRADGMGLTLSLLAQHWLFDCQLFQEESFKKKYLKTVKEKDQSKTKQRSTLSIFSTATYPQFAMQLWKQLNGNSIA